MQEIEKILLLEDLDEDKILIERQLRASNIWAEIFVCTNEKDFKDTINKIKPDVILSDYDVPGFDGLEALKLCKTYYPDIPFIFITGTISLEVAEETLITKGDAYILKDNIEFLGEVVSNIWFKFQNTIKFDFGKQKLDELEDKIRTLNNRMDYYLRRNKALISGNRFRPDLDRNEGTK
ncbi:response regulator transcription factor [Chondrinema litorale]|uniref:response regulator transcription factor n=1 Tax=Chondrinema litorale TaxID=2994555 RepID=UPI002542C34B|nr:response regulator [Chondrinema litorale]UZR94764.1 response regulator [Chondrinema litorale]